jgi:hypothetical protein
VNRLLKLSALSLTAVFLVTSIGLAATGTSKSTTSSKVTPTRDKKKPYKFKTTGKVSFPTTFCQPNRPASTCLALRCPAGATNAKYCTKPTLAQVCTGKIKLVFKQGTKTRATKTVNLRTTCKYTATVTIKRRARLKLTVSFAGNTVLKASKASRKSLRAG